MFPYVSLKSIYPKIYTTSCRGHLGQTPKFREKDALAKSLLYFSLGPSEGRKYRTQMSASRACQRGQTQNPNVLCSASWACVLILAVREDW